MKNSYTISKPKIKPKIDLEKFLLGLKPNIQPRTLGELKSDQKNDHRFRKQKKSSIIELQPILISSHELILRMTLAENIVTLYLNEPVISSFSFNFMFLAPQLSQIKFGPVLCDHPLHLTTHEQQDSEVLQEHIHVEFKKNSITGKNLEEFFGLINLPANSSFSKSFRTPSKFDMCLPQPNISAIPQPFDSFYKSQYDDYQFEISELPEINSCANTLSNLGWLLLLGLALFAGCKLFSRLFEGPAETKKNPSIATNPAGFLQNLPAETAVIDSNSLQFAK